MRGMDEGRPTRLPAAPLVAVVVVLLLLPALYVLAIGPLGALVNNGYIPESTFGRALEVIYAPLCFCAEHCPPLKWFIIRYMQLCGGGE